MVALSLLALVLLSCWELVALKLLVLVLDDIYYLFQLTELEDLTLVVALMNDLVEGYWMEDC